MKTVKKTVKKYQAGGVQEIPPSKKSYKGAVSSKPNSKDEAVKKFKDTVNQKPKTPFQLNPDSKKVMKKGGAAKPKAMYGTAMKPGMMKSGMMKKGGTMKSK